MNKKMCQSCGMPLQNHGHDMRGTNADQSLSDTYCKFCYANGEFIEPNITYEEILERGLKGIDAGPDNKFKKMLLKKGYPMMLKKTTRWNRG